MLRQGILPWALQNPTALVFDHRASCLVERVNTAGKCEVDAFSNANCGSWIKPGDELLAPGGSEVGEDRVAEPLDDSHFAPEGAALRRLQGIGARTMIQRRGGSTTA